MVQAPSPWGNCHLENGQRVLVHVSRPSPSFITCYSFTINKRVSLGSEKMIRRNRRYWIVSCLRAAVMLATDKGKINAEVHSVGQGICFLRVFWF